MFIGGINVTSGVGGGGIEIEGGGIDWVGCWIMFFFAWIRA